MLDRIYPPERCPICPRCSKRTLEKMGQYGHFFGCDWPKCEFTANIDEALVPRRL